MSIAVAAIVGLIAAGCFMLLGSALEGVVPFGQCKKENRNGP